MLNFNPDDILCTPLYRFLPPAEAVSIMAAILAVFKTGLPLWHSYSFRDHSFFWLINKMGDDITAVHEVFDDPDNRCGLKKFLLVAAGNFNKQFKESGDKNVI